MNRDVIVRLKWGETEYKGRLVSIDSYLNIQLSGTEEYIEDKPPTTLGEVLIRYVPLSLSVPSTVLLRPVLSTENAA